MENRLRVRVGEGDGGSTLESSTENIYIAICEIASQWGFAV